MKKSLNEQIGRIKEMMNLNEDDSQDMEILQQETEQFNEKVDEDLTPEEYKEIVCMDENTPIDMSELPPNTKEQDKKQIEELKNKMKQVTSIPELLKLKKQFKEFRKQQQNEQILSLPVGTAGLGAANATFLGISMSPMAAVGASIVLGGLLLFLLGRLLFPRTRTKTIWCRKPDRF